MLASQFTHFLLLNVYSNKHVLIITHLLNELCLLFSSFAQTLQVALHVNLQYIKDAYNFVIIAM